MASAKPQALLRALLALGEQSLLLGGRPPPAGGNAGALRQHLIRNHASQPGTWSSSRASSEASFSRRVGSGKNWDRLVAVANDAFQVVFRGVYRARPFPEGMAKSMRKFAKHTHPFATTEQSGLSGYARQCIAGRATHPFRVPRLSVKVTPHVHQMGLQSARNFSQAGVSDLIFNVPLALRAFVDELEDELRKDHAGPSTRRAKAKIGAGCGLRSPKRAGDVPTMPYKFASLGKIRRSCAIAESLDSVSLVDTLAAKTDVEETDKVSATDHDDFDYYFDRLEATPYDEDAEVVSVLCVPLDPDLTTIYDEAIESQRQRSPSPSSSMSSDRPLVDFSFLKQRQRLHDDYEFHALRYIVPLEHALDTPIWREHLPRNWDMSMLITSAIDGVQRGKHCLEIRFVGTPATVIEDLLYETMGPDRGRWYSVFLSEERVQPEELAQAAALAQSEQQPATPSHLSVPPSVTTGRESRIHDVGLDVADLGAASRISFDELGYKSNRSADRSVGSSQSCRSAQQQQNGSLQFPVLALAGSQRACESGFASAFLSRYSDDFCV